MHSAKNNELCMDDKDIMEATGGHVNEVMGEIVIATPQLFNNKQDVGGIIASLKDDIIGRMK